VTTDAERFASWAQGAGSPQPLALSARCAALLGPPQDAEASYLRAVQLHRVADHPMEHARTELLLGEHLRRQRRRQDARVHLRTALDVFGRLGAQPWAQRARAELRAAGERVPDAATPAGLASLTPQEARIVAAVREGLTNREIAAGLFLSPRTVDYHLRKVFQKLGVSARAQLVRFDS
jgi:DNA-binding CsgD family transcriptional regulator